MKMILAIIGDHDNEPVSQALIKSGFRVTRIASTGAFYRRGSTTLMVGVDDEKVDEAIAVVRQSTTPGSDPESKRATLFVLDVGHYSQV